MLFARLEQVLPNQKINEPFLFCATCYTYFMGRPGFFCPMCGHKFNFPTEPQMITVKLNEEMTNEEAVNFVRNHIKG